MKKLFEKLEKKFQVDWIDKNLDIIMIICGFIVLGTLAFTLIQTIFDRDEYRKLFFKEKSKNITLTTEKEELEKKNKKCEDGSVLIYNAGLTMSDWKDRTEIIMIKIDNVLGRYNELTKNYCIIDDENTSSFIYEYKSILEDYQNTISDYKTLLEEQNNDYDTNVSSKNN